MKQRLAQVTIVVKDYDEALEFYTRKLSFTIVEDTRLTEEKRWVLIAPPVDGNCCILLAKASNERQAATVGNQTGGRVAFFLHTDDFWRDFERLNQNEVKFVRQPQEEEYGIVAVFEDLYGNLWDLVQPNGGGQAKPEKVSSLFKMPLFPRIVRFCIFCISCVPFFPQGLLKHKVRIKNSDY